MLVGSAKLIVTVQNTGSVTSNYLVSIHIGSYHVGCNIMFKYFNPFRFQYELALKVFYKCLRNLLPSNHI